MVGGLRLGRSLLVCFALRQLDGESERLGILATEAPRIRLRRRERAEDQREERGLGIDWRSCVTGAPPTPPSPSSVATHGGLLVPRTRWASSCTPAPAR